MHNDDNYPQTTAARARQKLPNGHSRPHGTQSALPRLSLLEQPATPMSHASHARQPATSSRVVGAKIMGDDDHGTHFPHRFNDRSVCWNRNCTSAHVAFLLLKACPGSTVPWSRPGSMDAPNKACTFLTGAQEMLCLIVRESAGCCGPASLVLYLVCHPAALPPVSSPQTTTTTSSPSISAPTHTSHRIPQFGLPSAHPFRSRLPLMQ